MKPNLIAVDDETGEEVGLVLHQSGSMTLADDDATFVYGISGCTIYPADKFEANKKIFAQQKAEHVSMNKQEWCFNGNQVRTLKGGLVTVFDVTEDRGVRCSDGLYWCRTELESLANGLNGYKWGKEYQTNGKKPDLPDDVVIFYETKTGHSATTSGYGLDWGIGKRNEILTFRIVDERYKPKETPMPEQNTEHDNSWPAVGWHGEVTWGNKIIWYECVVLPNNNIARVNGLGDWLILPTDEHENVEFRVIKSERERFVEAALGVMQTKRISNTQRKTINRLFDSGKFKLVEDENRSA